MKVIITGATGYIGSNLARRLINENYNVHIIIRSNSSLHLINDIADELSIHIHDGTTERMIDICEKAKPEIVFHLASACISQHKSEDIYSLINSNILFGTQIAEAMSRKGIKYLINTGTSWQHYESDEYNPVCLYAATKQAFEDILKYYIEAEGLRVITLKLFDTYGPNDPRPKIMNLLKGITESGKELSLSQGEQYIDIVYIDDVVEAFLNAANRIKGNLTRKKECYAVTSGNLIKLKDLVKIFEKLSRKNLNINWGGRPYRNREVMLPWNKGKVLDGWKPRISIEKGILKLIEY